MTSLSGITPSGHPHLGNYLGAIRHWAAATDPGDLYFVSNMHAMTLSYDPSTLRSLTREMHAVLLAAGIPADRVFVQSDLIAEHSALTWILQCVCTYGEARRMIQFKEKSDGQSGVRLGLLTYPTLMAADILLHGADRVPVGADQRQHVELARALATRFNGAYGTAFVVPEAAVPPAGDRVMDLSAPNRKMAKSAAASTGVIAVMDPPDLVVRKISRAVTDSLDNVRYAPEEQPGVSNLLDIAAAVSGEDIDNVAARIGTYGELKKTVTELVVDALDPVRDRATALLADTAELDRLRGAAAERIAAAARHRLHAARRLAGID